MADDDTKRGGLAERSLADGGMQNKELAEVCGRFADICQYFSQHHMDLPSQIVEEVRLVTRLSVEERITRMKQLTQELMEYLNHAGPDPQVRQ